MLRRCIWKLNDQNCSVEKKSVIWKKEMQILFLNIVKFSNFDAFSTSLGITLFFFPQANERCRRWPKWSPRSFYFWSWNFMNIIRESNFKMGEGVKKLEGQNSVRKLQGAFMDGTHILGTYKEIPSGRPRFNAKFPCKLSEWPWGIFALFWSPNSIWKLHEIRVGKHLSPWKIPKDSYKYFYSSYLSVVHEYLFKYLPRLLLL